MSSEPKRSTSFRQRSGLFLLRRSVRVQYSSITGHEDCSAVLQQLLKSDRLPLRGTESGWPLPSVVYSIGFELADSVGQNNDAAPTFSYANDCLKTMQTRYHNAKSSRFAQGKRVILISNTNSSATSVWEPGFYILAINHQCRLRTGIEKLNVS